MIIRNHERTTCLAPLVAGGCVVPIDHGGVKSSADRNGRVILQAVIDSDDDGCDGRRCVRQRARQQIVIGVSVVFIIAIVITVTVMVIITIAMVIVSAVPLGIFADGWIAAWCCPCVAPS